MCEPVTLVAVGTMAAGGALGAYSQYKQGQAANDAAKANARTARMQGDAATNQGAIDAAKVTAEGNQVAAQGVAASAANNIDSTTGSTADVIAASSASAAADAARVKSNAARAAWGFATEAKDLEKQGRAAKQAGILGALGTGLSTVGSAASVGAQGYANSQAAKYRAANPNTAASVGAQGYANSQAAKYRAANPNTSGIG